MHIVKDPPATGLKREAMRLLRTANEKVHKRGAQYYPSHIQEAYKGKDYFDATVEGSGDDPYNVLIRFNDDEYDEYFGYDAPF